MSFFDWVTDSIIEEPQERKPVTVGWLFNDEESSVIYEDPEKVLSSSAKCPHAKSASRCPAVLDLESRHFMIQCPFNIHLGFVRDSNGKAQLQNKLEDKSPVRLKQLEKLIALVPEKEWRYADRPTLQVKTPYIFVADEPVYMSQIAPFMHYLSTPWPGTIFGGRFPIHVWPRRLMWAFEWHDISKDLMLKRGDPWFYVTFETLPSDRVVTMKQTEKTPELESYLSQISEAVNFVNQTFSLFKTAEKRRPKTLLKPKSED